MKRVLLIASFEQNSKDFYNLISNAFSTQFCQQNAEMAANMLSMFEPDAVVVFLDQMDCLQEGIFTNLDKYYSDTPVIIVGTEAEFSQFSSHVVADNFNHLKMPVTKEEIKDLLYNVMGVNEGEVSTDVAENARPLVLFVDDDPLLLRSVKRMIDHEYRISIATSGAQAMFLIGQEKPDMIFLDYEMPNMNGRMMLEMLRTEESTKDIPVVFLTGQKGKQQIEPILKYHLSGYILKPPVKEVLLKTIKDTIKK